MNDIRLCPDLTSVRMSILICILADALVRTNALSMERNFEQELLVCNQHLHSANQAHYNMMLSNQELSNKIVMLEQELIELSNSKQRESLPNTPVMSSLSGGITNENTISSPSAQSVDSKDYPYSLQSTGFDLNSVYDHGSDGTFVIIAVYEFEENSDGFALSHRFQQDVRTRYPDDILIQSSSSTLTLLDRTLSFTDCFDESLESLYQYHREEIAKWLSNLIYDLSLDVIGAEIYSILWNRHQITTAAQSEILNFIQRKHFEALDVRNQDLSLNAHIVLRVNESLFNDVSVMILMLDLYQVTLGAVMNREYDSMMESAQNEVSRDIHDMFQRVIRSGQNIVNQITLLLKENINRLSDSHVFQAIHEFSVATETWNNLKLAIQCGMLVADGRNARIIQNDEMSAGDWNLFEKTIAKMSNCNAVSAQVRRYRVSKSAGELSEYQPFI